MNALDFSLLSLKRNTINPQQEQQTNIFTLILKGNWDSDTEQTSCQFYKRDRDQVVDEENDLDVY